MKTNKDTEWLDEILKTLAEDLINYDARMTEAKAPPIRFVYKYNNKAKQSILTYIKDHYTANEDVEKSELQLLMNIWTQYKVAMMAQEVSTRPPEGARFRTPLEELTVIIEPMQRQRLNNNKKEGK